ALGVNAIANRFVSYLVRTAVFFPFIISWAAVALLWQYMLDPAFGVVTYYIESLGLTAPEWFLNPAWALPAIIGIDFWHTLGFTFIIMLAGLQTVPQQLIEAARTDGASTRQAFWHVTVPMMSPTLFFAMVVTFIGAFQIFDPIQIITGGGPDDATLTLVMYMYEQGFQSFQIGYASAVAFVVFVVIMAVTLRQCWAARTRGHDQGAAQRSASRVRDGPGRARPPAGGRGLPRDVIGPGRAAACCRRGSCSSRRSWSPRWCG